MSRHNGNLYIRLLATSLSRIGVEVQSMPTHLTADWLTKNRDDSGGQILHFHWPSYSYTVGDREQTRQLVDSWIGLLKLARTLDYKIVWTAHNLYPHDALHLDLQCKAREHLIRGSSAVIVHTNAALREITSTFPELQPFTVVIPHGHYMGCYSRYHSSSDARVRLGVPKDSFIYLSFGHIRPYKGIPSLLTTFSEAKLDDSVLLIAGQPWTATIGRDLLTETRSLDHVYLHPFFVPDDEVPIYFAAANVVVLAYSEALTSGVSVLAHSLGKPVIAPAIGGLLEMVPPGTGWLYDPYDSNGLRDALRLCQNADQAVTSESCIEFARSLDWHTIALATRELYLTILGPDR